MSDASAQTEQDPAKVLKAKLERVIRHQQAQRFDQAMELLGECEIEYGDIPEIIHLKGLTLYQMGQHDEGIYLVEEAVELSPDHAGMVADLGALMAQKGRIDDALPHFERATELAPNYAGGWTNLGAAHFLKQDYAAAIPSLRKAVELEPGLLDAQRNLGIAMNQVNRFKQAVEVFYRALAIDPNDVSSHVHLSAALYRDERHDTAIHHAEKAMELAPQALEPHLHLGNALASVGRMEEAEKHLMKAASLMPQGIGALSRLIHLRKTEEDSPEFKALLKLEDRIDRFPDQRRSTLHFAAGKAYADLGQYEVSFDHLSKGNAITAEEHSFDLENHVGQVDKMIELTTPALVERIGAASKLTDVAPIFVCGMPRSGTTLMELMLSQHSKVQAGGEMNASRVAYSQCPRLVAIMEERATGEIEANDMALLGEAYIDAVRRNGISAEVFTDKLPINYMYVGMLALAMPRAQFVVMRRHPMDCLLSNWTQDFGRNQPFSTTFKGLGTTYMQYHRITDYWAQLMPDRVRITPYESVIDQPRAEMEAVLAHCNLDWEDDVLEHASSSRPVNTASIGQVRQPLYKTSVAKWMRYGALLKPMAEEVAELLSEDDRVAAGLPRAS